MAFSDIFKEKRHKIDLELSKEENVLDDRRKSFLYSLMTDHSSFRSFLSKEEYFFINALEKEISKARISLPLNYQIRGNMLNFKIGNYQIGRLEIFQPPYRIQIITRTNVKWVDLISQNDSLCYVHEWIRYSKQIDTH